MLNNASDGEQWRCQAPPCRAMAVGVPARPRLPWPLLSGRWQGSWSAPPFLSPGRRSSLPHPHYGPTLSPPSDSGHGRPHALICSEAPPAPAMAHAARRGVPALALSSSVNVNRCSAIGCSGGGCCGGGGGARCFVATEPLVADMQVKRKYRLFLVQPTSSSVPHTGSPSQQPCKKHSNITSSRQRVVFVRQYLPTRNGVRKPALVDVDSTTR